MLSLASQTELFINQGFAVTYLTVQQAQQVLAPNVNWLDISLTISKEQAELIEKLSGQEVTNLLLKVWRSPDGDFFITDNVFGKHEYITYALLISPGSEIKGLEILDYRETYGDQIRQQNWRQQFVGKSANDPLELTKDILNISGATISCNNITRGVKRLLTTFETVLKDKY